MQNGKKRNEPCSFDIACDKITLNIYDMEGKI